MSIVEVLLDTARSDTDLLLQNDAKGDHLDIPRDIDFLLRAPSQEKAFLVRDFINDNQYGRAHVEEHAGSFNIIVMVFFAPQQHTLCSVSGLMACLSKIFDVEYDGWGCVLQIDSTQALK